MTSKKSISNGFQSCSEPSAKQHIHFGAAKTSGNRNAVDGYKTLATTCLVILRSNGVTVETGETLAGDTDVDTATNGQVLSISAVRNARHGTITILPNGNLQFTPERDYFGVASFIHTVSDGVVVLKDIKAPKTDFRYTFSSSKVPPAQWIFARAAPKRIVTERNCNQTRPRACAANLRISAAKQRLDRELFHTNAPLIALPSVRSNRGYVS